MTSPPVMHRIAVAGLAVAGTLLLIQCSLLSEESPSPELGCSVQAPSTTESTPSRSCSSQKDRREARLLAVWLTGELRPDTTLTRRLCRDLDRLRQEFADSYPVVADRRFQAAWVSRNLSLKFDSSAAQAIRKDRYEGWTTLPLSLRPDTLLDPPDKLGWSHVGFDEVYQMEKLGDQYERVLPGLIEGESNVYGFAGFSTSPILPLWDGETLGLVFTGGSSRPPTHFFRISNGDPEFVERWNGEGNPPDWLEKARKAWKNCYTPES